ncbi:MAG: hypothetical protein ABSC06_19745 [Rhodopila sp.]|jgi:hypothetical protein
MNSTDAKGLDSLVAATYSGSKQDMSDAPPFQRRTRAFAEKHLGGITPTEPSAKDEVGDPLDWLIWLQWGQAMVPHGK